MSVRVVVRVVDGNRVVVSSPGAQGVHGPSTDLTIGNVTTVSPGGSATASVTGVPPDLQLDLGIPRGDKGEKGDTGATNSLSVGTVTTGAPGSSASITITGTAPNQTLSMSIPRGDNGQPGAVYQPEPPSDPYLGMIWVDSDSEALPDTALQKASNLADLVSAASARTNLGLGTAAVKDTGTGAGNVILGNDARLTDSRTPNAHTHAPAEITGTAVVTGDSRLSDARTPTPHANTHGVGQTDAVTPAAIGARPESLVAFSNADHNCAATTRTLMQIGTLTAPRSVNLPAASAVSAGAEIVIGDSSGTVTATNTLSIRAAGSDTINGSALIVIGGSNGWRRLVSDGVSRWSWDEGVIRSSNATTKGDIFAATAASTVGRFGVGPSGSALRSNPSADTGLEWVRQSVATPVGYYWCDGVYEGTQGMPTIANRLYMWPILCQEAQTVSEVRLYVSTVADTGALWRLGFWAPSANGALPGALLADCGTVNPTGATGFRSWTSLAVPFPAGVLWAGIVFQGSGAGGGEVYAQAPKIAPAWTSPGTIGAGHMALYQASISAGMPNPAVVAASTSFPSTFRVPLIEMLRSA